MSKLKLLHENNKNTFVFIFITCHIASVAGPVFLDCKCRVPGVSFQVND